MREITLPRGFGLGYSEFENSLLSVQIWPIEFWISVERCFLDCIRYTVDVEKADSKQDSLTEPLKTPYSSCGDDYHEIVSGRIKASYPKQKNRVSLFLKSV